MGASEAMGILSSANKIFGNVRRVEAEEGIRVVECGFLKKNRMDAVNMTNKKKRGGDGN